MRRVTPIGAALLAAAFAAACGGSSAASPERALPPERAPAPEPVDAASLPSPPTPWDQMDSEAQAQWMYAEVVPRMSERFEDFDEDRYGGMDCATCHGPDPESRGFAMPSPALPPLPERGTPEAEALHAEHPEVIAFMAEEVVPTMRALLGKGEDFSCHSCHPHAG